MQNGFIHTTIIKTYTVQDLFAIFPPYTAIHEYGKQLKTTWIHPFLFFSVRLWHSFEVQWSLFQFSLSFQWFNFNFNMQNVNMLPKLKQYTKELKDVFLLRTSHPLAPPLVCEQLRSFLVYPSRVPLCKNKQLCLWFFLNFPFLLTKNNILYRLFSLPDVSWIPLHLRSQRLVTFFYSCTALRCGQAP